MLKVDDVSVYYGHIHALKGVSLEIKEGEIVALIGSNGAGKTTLLNAISGMVKVSSGTIRFEGTDISNHKAQDVVKSGIIHCPEGRKVFGDLPVYENILAGALARKDKKKIKEEADAYMDRFERLKERRKQLAKTLSGGEQQMLAICRSLIGRPKILLLDEPSMGLSPTMVQEVFRIIQETNQEGITILLVEQNANLALKISNHAYVIESGLIVQSGISSDLLASDEIRKAYLGEA
ncbi:ABC transporter ATP-binding protein [Clostridia bacterium]|nr:ABC transporter ATP-binding protein [Clostridia bacterium]